MSLGIEMRILSLYGWHSAPGGVKPTHLKDHSHEVIVINPVLDDDDFVAALATAQAAFDQHQSQVVVRSSHDGAVAMNINSGEVRLVLLCPAWKNWGTAEAVILHSRAKVIRFADSQELVRNSELAESALVEVGNDTDLLSQCNYHARMIAESGAFAVNPRPSFQAFCWTEVRANVID